MRYLSSSTFISSHLSPSFHSIVFHKMGLLYWTVSVQCCVMVLVCPGGGAEVVAHLGGPLPLLRRQAHRGHGMAEDNETKAGGLAHLHIRYNNCRPLARLGLALVLEAVQKAHTAKQQDFVHDAAHDSSCRRPRKYYLYTSLYSQHL